MSFSPKLALNFPEMEKKNSASYTGAPSSVISNVSRTLFLHRRSITSRVKLTDIPETRSNLAMEKLLVLDDMDNFRDVMKVLWSDNWTTRVGVTCSIALILIITILSQNLLQSYFDPDKYTFSTFTSDLSTEHFNALT
eukprot:UN02561